ncbi:MAG: monoamine oxidase [Cognaticolwellia sp.]|jgi:monoamine oxidase
MILLLLACSTPEWREALDVEPVDEPECIIVGPGVAGLSAAQALHLGGVQVTVLKARDRIGGRVWST